MTIVEVELFTDSGNNAVIRLPPRKYPGVLIQGDTLSNLITTASEALDALKRSDTEEAQELLRDLTTQLEAARERYEAALRDHGVEKPY